MPTKVQLEEKIKRLERAADVAKTKLYTQTSNLSARIEELEETLDGGCCLHCEETKRSQNTLWETLDDVLGNQPQGWPHPDWPTSSPQWRAQRLLATISY